MQQTWASIDYFPHDCNILILKKYDAENSVEMLLLQANRQFVREHLSEQSKPIIKLRLHSSDWVDYSFHESNLKQVLQADHL